MTSYIFILKDESLLKSLHILLSKVNKEAIWIGVSTVTECEEQLKRILDQYDVKYNLIVNTEEFSDYYKLDQFLPSLKNGWTYVHEVGKPFRAGIDSKIKKFIANGGKFAFVSDEHEGVNDTCFYNVIYKMLRGNKPEPNQMINFYDKIEREDPKMLKKWSDIDELCDN